jgi:hypothetical protein
MCDACAAWDVDGRVACEACGSAEGSRSRALGASLLAVTSAAYLATVALFVALGKPRPFVGGLAAVLAIVLGRSLRLVFRPRAVTRLDPG